MTVCRGYAEAYEVIKANRLKKKLAKEEEAARLLEQKESGTETNEFVCQEGDMVTVSWDARLASTGEQVERNSPIFGTTNRPGKPEVELTVQVGTEVGFEPKSGLRLAISIVCRGKRAGEVTKVICKPSGSGWLKSYDIVSEGGRVLAQMTSEERACKWANDEVCFNIKIVRVTPPRGREAKRRLAV